MSFGFRATQSKLSLFDLSCLLDYSIGGSSRPGDRPFYGRRGKSELYRAGCWVTPRRGDPTESATETYRSPEATKGEMVR